MSESNLNEKFQMPNSSGINKTARAAMQVTGGAIPVIGGVLSAISSAWSENEQDKVNRFFEQWVRMLQDEIKEKEITIIEIMSRLDFHDQEIANRVESREFQSLLRKTFREWSGAESEDKRVFIRNIMVNAAASRVTSDDVIRMFIDWINKYSEMHFQVIAAIYNSDGITRKQIWDKIGKGTVREDSADADLYKLLIRDLSTGGIIRQHREVDYYGNFIPKVKSKKSSGSSKRLVSAFDDIEGYELTNLGKQFVHYAMTDLPLRIEFTQEESDD